jgi:hypothetical protein
MTNLVIPSEESDQFATRFFQKETCQKLLLVAVVGCAILSLVPPLRIGAAIAMRSIALISSLASFHDMDSNNRLAIIAQNIGRCAIIILGIAGLATLSPFLIMISLVMDVSMQAFLCIKALYDGDYYAAALHFGMFVINTLAVSALVTGSWQVMVAAGAVSIVAMASIALGIAFYGNGRVEDVIDVTCYLALTLIGSFALTQMLPAAEGRAH